MSKKFILFVQGEGRGHMTQALSTYDLLIEQGDTVCAVVLGSAGTRDVPDFFFKKIYCPIVQVKSPNFASDKKNKSISLTKSILSNLSKIGDFRNSLKTIHALMEEHQPDFTINFFDVLAGLYYRYYKPSAKMICIAHQYIYLHQDFEFPEGRWLDRMMIRYYTRLTASGSAKRLALSFYKIYTHQNSVTVVPPLLRKELFTLEAAHEDFYLVYLVNNGYFEEVLQWHLKNPAVVIHCFTDQPDQIYNNFKFDTAKLMVHSINDTLFLELMSKAKGLASSAGFESVCEAMYLGKPVMMVPVQGHYEQYCNSRDAFKAGAGIFSDNFDLNKLSNYTHTYDRNNDWFRTWVTLGRDRIYYEIIKA